MPTVITPAQAQHITEIVRKVMEKNHLMDKVIYYEFKNNRIKDEYDRSNIVEVSYELVRWWRMLLEIHNNYPVTRPVDYYQLLGTYLVIHGIDLPKIPQLRNIDATFIKSQLETLSNIRKIKYSIPDWLDQMGFLAYGSEWEDELKALNTPAPIFVRTNRLKIKPAELSQKLKAEGFDNQPVEGAPDALLIKTRTNIFSSALYKEGYFEVQDAGSQFISMALEVKPGMRVADMCAGTGGKTLHLASMMQNKGKIIAFDTQSNKLSELKSRLARAGVDMVETRLIESTKDTKRLRDSFDRVLIDAPCSGTGSIRRNPEIKWKMNTERLNNLLKIQANVLNSYADLVVKDGIVVYATCSILPAENQEQVQRFLEKKKGAFVLLKEQQILPSKTGFDGFYIAQLKRVQ
ncbi:MAG TPA: RsmB/NOP family class I SAM-dependent RNA methyltransferase [Bacteroidales bacterium]|nr:RsmB/NOP family class I SAM-dependent RNA methyltransferase [Bacteroidales bacterium]HOK98878.1 RsmB/NOP family class I SAM-dependent RNA methyltransferase [Bacteroidales bacterium]HPO66535.1 RsmB/NOP family class I SAM-dependent RNA methyltransferase [Bacteroidales bacterium]